MDFILASGSPARKAILETLGYRFRVIPSNSAEHTFSDPVQTVVTNATLKALAVARKNRQALPVVGCDTIVYYKGKIVGKPASTKDAARMLAALQGNVHEVYGAICVVRGNAIAISYSVAKVRIRPMGRLEIQTIAKRKETKNRAGAYAIQEGMAQLLKGRTDTVIGLDTSILEKLLSS